MCLLQVYPGEQKMSVKSACNCSCIPDPVTRHSDIINKAELEADMSMLKSGQVKWHRICAANHPKRKNHGKADNRNHRERKKSATNGVPTPNNPRPQPQQSYNEEFIEFVAAADENDVVAKIGTGGEALRDCDIVDCTPLRSIIRTPVVPQVAKMTPISKKVRFDDTVDKIVFQDDEESVDGRTCHWEVFARDRWRFMDRINQIDCDLKHIFHRDHRQRIYNERFLPLLLPEAKT